METFEEIKHIDEFDNEYWLARELSKTLEYTEYRKFLPVIKKAMITCEKSGQLVLNHFAHVGGMVNIGSNARRKVKDFKLSRYACYLIAQNSDSRKKVVAFAQTYFAIQTRKQELFEELSEDEKISDEYTASSIHYRMGKDVREFIKQHGGTMPENLPTPKQSINEIEKEIKQLN